MAPALASLLTALSPLLADNLLPVTQGDSLAASSPAPPSPGDRLTTSSPAPPAPGDRLTTSSPGDRLTTSSPGDRLTSSAPSLPSDGLLPLPGEPEPAVELVPIDPTAAIDPASERELPLVHGGFAAPTAWLALWRGDAWICWDLAALHCWQRLDLAGQVDLATLRAEFVDRSTLVLGDRSDIPLLIVRGDPVPRRVAWTATPRQSPQSHGCSPSGPLPIADDTGLHARDRPCPEARERHESCAHPGHALRLRKPQPLRLRLALELQARSDWRVRPDLSATSGMQLIAFVAIGLDPAGWLLQRRERADLQAQARPGLRALPTARSRGPLLAAERLALRTAICGATP